MSIATVEVPGGIMSHTVEISDATARLAQLIARAEAGEDVTIVQDGVPVARIVPVKRPISETIGLMRRERGRRQRVSAEDNRAAKEQGRS